MIVAAALRYNGMILSMPKPARHHHIIHIFNEATIDLPEHLNIHVLEQGFLTDKGEFLDRKLAMIHQLATGFGLPRREQMKADDPNSYDGPELFSEDLW